MARGVGSCKASILFYFFERELEIDNAVLREIEVEYIILCEND